MSVHAQSDAITKSCFVHKFGGSSLGSAQRFQAVTDILRRQSAELWVVVSAPGDTTDALLDIIAAAESGRPYQAALDELTARLALLVRQTLPGSAAVFVIQQLTDWLAAVPALLSAQSVNDVLAIGERLSSLLLSHLLTTQGISAVAVDARDFLVLDNCQVNWALSARRLATIQQAGYLHVVTGFIGRDSQEQTITLGRNGSDYSATILGRLVSAASVSIWTDVNAIYSTDPRRVSSAVPYRLVGWQQACQLAQLGNPVLHARTLSALEQTATELVVRSSFLPDDQGCRVVTQGAGPTEFLTELQQQVLLSLHDTSPLTAADLALVLQKPVIQLPHTGEGQSWLIAADVAAKAVALLKTQGVHAVWDTQQYAAVAWIKPVAGASLAVSALHYLQQLAVTHQYENDHLAIWLFKKELSVVSMSELHQRCIQPLPELHVLVAGVGNVGGEFLQLLEKQQRRWAGKLNIKLAAVFNSAKACLQQDIAVTRWQQLFDDAPEYQPQQLFDYIASIDGPKVLVDITPSKQFAECYPQFIGAGCHLISANKQGVTLPSVQYRQIKDALLLHKRSWLSNTTVGAGIPVQRVLQELLASGDTVQQISGIFSGTLSWLLCRFDGSKAFSEFVLEAQQLGLTEPDPRDDLSGKDVQRKLLVLARELGLELELEQIALQPLLPSGLESGSWQAFWQQRDLLDHALAAAYQKASLEGKVLRYVATLHCGEQQVTANVELRAVATDDPLAAITPCDNIFVIESDWYQANPLVLKGPGAGRQVTAGGIHADLAVLVQHLLLASGQHLKQ